jgi:hypothetical protein
MEAFCSKIYSFFSTVFFPIFDHQPLDPDPVMDPDWYLAKMLDPDSMNPDPKHRTVRWRRENDTVQYISHGTV